MKKHLILLTCLCVGMFAFCGCSSQEPDAEAKQESSQEKETKAPEDMVYALVTKSEGNRYNELQAQGFRTVIEESGAVCVVEYPKSTAAMEQVRIIEQLIEDDVDAIAIAANDADALNDVLQKARDAGILITTLDSNVNPEYTSLFINQVDTKRSRQLCWMQYMIFPEVPVSGRFYPLPPWHRIRMPGSRLCVKL